MLDFNNGSLTLQSKMTGSVRVSVHEHNTLFDVELAFTGRILYFSLAS